MVISLVPPVKNIIQGNLFVQMDFMQCPHLMDINMFQSWFLCFLTVAGLSPVDRPTLLLEKITPT